MKLILLFEVGDQVDILRTIDDSDQFYSGVVEVDDSDGRLPYKVKIDQTGREGWFSEDDLGAQPTKAQVAQFGALVDRVLKKLNAHEKEA
jgi:hypothetical protein